jgi:nucleoside-diphosphate-sugar epimerase
MRIYITGSTGFVGKVLIKKLLDFGFEIFPIVRKNSGIPNEILLDLAYANEEELFDVFKGADCIIHLAAHANFGKNFDFDTYNINCLANLRLVNVISKLDTHLVFASNALIAGIDNEYITKESPDIPEIPYNISKYLSETYIKTKLSNYTILRIGGIFGLGGPQHLFLNKAIENVKRSVTLDLSDNGLGKRNYIFVEDLCEWIISIVRSKQLGTVLMAGNDIVSMNEILSALYKVFLGEDISFKIGSLQGKNQIIHSEVSSITIHSYERAFEIMKNELS